MSLSQGYSVGKVLFLPVLNDSGSDCTIVTLGSAAEVRFAWPANAETSIRAISAKLGEGVCFYPFLRHGWYRGLSSHRRAGVDMVTLL
jgi:hypothetical protein